MRSVSEILAESKANLHERPEAQQIRQIGKDTVLAIAKEIIEQHGTVVDFTKRSDQSDQDFKNDPTSGFKNRSTPPVPIVDDMVRLNEKVSRFKGDDHVGVDSYQVQIVDHNDPGLKDGVIYNIGPSNIQRNDTFAYWGRKQATPDRLEDLVTLFKSIHQGLDPENITPLTSLPPEAPTHP